MFGKPELVLSYFDENQKNSLEMNQKDQKCHFFIFDTISIKKV